MVKRRAMEGVEGLIQVKSNTGEEKMGENVIRNGSRNLIILRAGDSSLHGSWLGKSSDDRHFDVHISYFGKIGTPRPFDQHMSISYDYQSNKWPGLAAAVQSGAFSLDDYDYIALPDDDIVASAEAWNLGFAMAREYGVAGCQLSLNHASFFGWSDTLNRPELKLRFVTAIEFMVPIISVELFRKMLPYFPLENNVWAMDAIAYNLQRNQPNSLAILDAIKILHTRAFWTGPLYDHLRDAKRSPQASLELFLRDHDLAPAERVCTGAIDKKGRHLDSGDVRNHAFVYARALNAYRRYFGHLRLAAADNGQVFLLRNFRGVPGLPVDRRKVKQIRPGALKDLVRWRGHAPMSA